MGSISSGYGVADYGHFEARRGGTTPRSDESLKLEKGEFLYL
jgi:hypothetical protein